MATDLTVAELYPVTMDMHVTALVQAVLTWERDTDGKFLLSRELTHEEHRFLRERRAKLAEALAHATDAEIRKSVSRMMIGFMAGKDVSDQNAKAIVTQYIITLRTLPLWAIERTCQKFSRGEIEAIRDENVKLAYGPSTAQLYQVAAQLCADFYRELTDVDHVIRGRVKYQPTEEERQRIKDGLKDLADSIRVNHESTQPPKWYEKPLTEERAAEIAADLRNLYGKKPREDAMADEA